MYENTAEEERKIESASKRCEKHNLYEDLRTVSSIIYSTFKEAFENNGLTETSSSHDDCLRQQLFKCHLLKVFLQEYWYFERLQISMQYGTNTRIQYLKITTSRTPT